MHFDDWFWSDRGEKGGVMEEKEYTQKGRDKDRESNEKNSSIWKAKWEKNLTKTFEVSEVVVLQEL